MSDQLSEFVIAMGALAETLRLFRDELLKNGFTRAETITLTKAYMHEILSQTTKNKEDI